MSTVVIREIKLEDNLVVAQIIKKVLEDFGVPKEGSAYADASLNNMFEAYNNPKSVYYVVELNNRIVGGAGIAPLDNFDGNVCELQKMYFLEEVRGKGIGSKMIKHCLQAAKELGFDKCYLETMPYMKAAQSLYQKNGFSYLNNPLGDTGHHACTVWMIKDLT